MPQAVERGADMQQGQPAPHPLSPQTQRNRRRHPHLVVDELQLIATILSGHQAVATTAARATVGQAAGVVGDRQRANAGRPHRRQHRAREQVKGERLQRCLGGGHAHSAAGLIIGQGVRRGPPQLAPKAGQLSSRGRRRLGGAVQPRLTRCGEGPAAELPEHRPHPRLHAPQAVHLRVRVGGTEPGGERGGPLGAVRTRSRRRAQHTTPRSAMAPAPGRARTLAGSDRANSQRFCRYRTARMALVTCCRVCRAWVRAEMSAMYFWNRYCRGAWGAWQKHRGRGA